MTTIAQSAKEYVPKPRMKNITELNEVSTAMDLQRKDLKDKSGKSFTVSYIVVNDEEYRVPDSVLNSLQVILGDNPNLTKFKVKSQGTGIDTSYTVIPLM